jgi:hypothetical protein
VRLGTAAGFYPEFLSHEAVLTCDGDQTILKLGYITIFKFCYKNIIVWLLKIIIIIIIIIIDF